MFLQMGLRSMGAVRGKMSNRLWEPTLLLLGVLVYGLGKPTSGPARRLFPSSIQVLPVVVPPAPAMLVLCRWDQQSTAEQLCHALACRHCTTKEAEQRTSLYNREKLLEEKDCAGYLGYPFSNVPLTDDE
jgi:hypothetical protein